MPHTKLKWYLHTVNTVLDNIQADVIWLKHNVEPWQTSVIEKWKNTFAIRHVQCDEKTSLENFLKEWPVLNDPRANILVIFWQIIIFWLKKIYL